MGRSIITIVMAFVLAACCVPDARAAVPDRNEDTWRVAELPAALDADAASIVAGSHEAAFLQVPGNTVPTSITAPRWYRLNLAHDWTATELPVLVVRDAGFTRVELYAPPDYQAQPLSLTVADDDNAARFSRHALAFVLPAQLHADQPLYLRLDQTLLPKFPHVTVVDLRSYQATDLRHVRLSTLFSSVQFAMILVALCLWLALRDRMFVSFLGYASLQLIYLMLVSGEVYSLPLGSWLSPLGQKASWIFAVLSAPLSINFILQFCDLRRIAPRMATLLAATRWPYMFILALLLLPITLDARYIVLQAFANLMLLLGSIVAIAAVAYAAYRGNRSSTYFLIAWMPQVAFTAMRVTQLLIGAGQPTWLEYGFPFTTAFSTIVVVLGLTEATLRARRERDFAQDLAKRDGLTGTLNRRALIERLHVAVADSQARGVPLALLFLDLDHFKAINDQRGHVAGDLCLKAVAAAITDELHDRQFCGRYGGEEFLAILPGTSQSEAASIGERLRRCIGALEIEADGRRLQLTVSIGIAVMSGVPDTLEQLIERADASLYRAKADGRNRVHIASPLLARTAS